MAVNAKLISSTESFTRGSALLMGVPFGGWKLLEGLDTAGWVGD
jgi:hypothetical protein